MGRTSREAASELSAETCRRLLGGVAHGMSDTQVGQIRDQLYALARVVANVYGDEQRPFEATIASLPEDQQAEVQERAAILEFEGKLTRDQAERLAISKYLRLPPRA